MISPTELRELREDLGYRWGLGRPLQYKELGLVLGFTGRDVGQTPWRWERGQSTPQPVAITLMRLMRDGYKPAHVDAVLGL